jgi:hypothetical protein
MTDALSNAPEQSTRTLMQRRGEQAELNHEMRKQSSSIATAAAVAALLSSEVRPTWDNKEKQ